MLKRLTQQDEQGNWSLTGVRWDDLHVGKEITRNTQERLYGALCKLKDYENTDLSPDQIFFPSTKKNMGAPKSGMSLKKKETQLHYHPN